MKKLFLTFALGISAIMFAQHDHDHNSDEKSQHAPPSGNALVGDSYGAGVPANIEKKAITPVKLEKKLKKTKKLESVSVKGKVVDVCDEKGCWATIDTGNGETFLVRMKDYGFFVPTALKGKNVVLDGTAEIKTISVDEQKHYAEDAKKSEQEIAKITEPKDEIRFVATGIRVVE
ncbi:MAG: DUF4920 domain-containing protein [Flavobacteriaceae bacterium]|jgi:hypothetical protein|nr:DUF4920 domain-containing protein [Flavobacteriaceae bacterium]